MPPNEFSKLETIGLCAFSKCQNLCNICFPEGATIKPCALARCEELDEVFQRCRAVDMFAGVESSRRRNLIRSLTTRFVGLPLLGLCYHQSYYHFEELVRRLNNIEISEGICQTDYFGMTPLHLLALSRSSNLNVWKYVIKKEPSNMKYIDKFQHFPLGYLLLSHCELAVLDVYFASRHELCPFESNLDYIVRCTLSYPSDKLRSILRLSLDRWENHQSWKQSIMDEVDRLCESSDSRERVTRAEHLKCKILRKYQTKEWSSLLELALWKTKMNQSIASSAISESEAFRQECRQQCGDEVIIGNVLPFLPDDQPSELHAFMQSVAEYRYEDSGQSVTYAAPEPEPFTHRSMFGLDNYDY